GLIGLEPLGWRGAAAAAVAFLGLALMIGARPGEFALLGVLLAFVAAVTRASMLLITRALLTTSDPRLSTWYSLLSSTLVFVVISLAALDRAAVGRRWDMACRLLGRAAARDPGNLRLPRPGGAVPRRAGDEPRAAARHDRERAPARRRDRARADGGRRHHAGRARSLP